MKKATTESTSTLGRWAGQYWTWTLTLLVAVVLLLILLPGSEADAEANQATARVERGPLTISVIESGTIRPREQVILRNDMDEDSTIVFIVEEGSRVKQGDLVVELDATVFETEEVERRIRVQNGEAALIYAQENFNVVTNQAQADIDQAELTLQFAKLDLEKYLDGEYPKQIKELEAQIALSEAELRRAEEDLRWSQILFEEKYLSQSDLQQDELTAKKATLDLELAREDLVLATNYTHLRQIAELNSNVKQAAMALERTKRKAKANIAQARAELRANEAEFEEDKERLRRVEREIEKAKIYAPIDGMVLYASSVSNDWDDDDPRIQVGTEVRERREIVYLPTADDYDVDIQIPEVNLNKLKRGQIARVEVDALPGEPLVGQVASISPLPDQRSRWMNPNLKLYNTVIALEPTSIGVRNGMSCQVEIVVEKLPDAVYVPLQSVVQLAGQSTVYVMEGNKSLPAPVVLGLDNNRVVQVVSGLEAGQMIALTPPLTSPDSGEETPAIDELDPAPDLEDAAVPRETSLESAPRTASIDQ
jgi:HlyD family secretion protein